MMRKRSPNMLRCKDQTLLIWSLKSLHQLRTAMHPRLDNFVELDQHSHQHSHVIEHSHEQNMSICRLEENAQICKQLQTQSGHQTQRKQLSNNS